MTEAVENRVIFVGGPWPKGHAIKEFAWSARLDPKTGIWFHLHLTSDDYSAEDNEGDADPEGDVANWNSKIVWNNYHACTISSVEWDHSGFLVATRESPLDMKALTGRELVVDPPPFDIDRDAAFGVYLQGHDTVAGHQIMFSRTAPAADWTVDWRGIIALTYLGGDEFRRKFVARKTGATFEGVELPADAKPDQTLDQLAPFVKDIKSYSLDKSPEGELRAKYKIR